MTITADDMQKITAQLKEEKQKLQNQIEELKTQDPFSDPERLVDNASSDTDAKEESVHDRYTAIIDELNDRLESVGDALVSIDAGTYGKCEKCGNLIETNRLVAMPSAKLCVSCSSKKEN